MTVCYTACMRKRAGALYIQDKKLFLISEGNQDFYWTPGGGLEQAESYEMALERELKEELDATLNSATLYLSIHDEVAEEDVNYYLVNITLPAHLPNGTKAIWYAMSDYHANTIKISNRVYTKVFPKLKAEGLV